MLINLPKNLISLAKKLHRPLYAVGGVVRNFLIDGSIAADVDLAAAIPAAEFVTALKGSGFTVEAEYKRTGTVMFSGDGYKYEFTSFRREKYQKGGAHTPISTEFTEDVFEDALRRDFKCNAIYYDIVSGEFVDPLNGRADIKDRVLDTVVEPEKVFSSDGLRLMRLARFTGELNFKPTYNVMVAAKKYADNVKDVSPERIFCELNLILQADGKYRFSDTMGHYNALKVLDETRVLDRIFPELTDGRGMAQRADFHRYDVLEHGLRSVAYAHPNVRLAALLHDVGKPYCLRRDGYYYHHFEEGERIAESILKRYKASNEVIKQVKYLVHDHMIDLDCSMKEIKVRKYIVKNHDRLEELMMVKQADFRASLEIDDTAPALVKWKRIYERMKADGTPFNLKELEITASDLIKIGFSGEQIGKELKSLLDYAVINPDKNETFTLRQLAERDYNRLKG